MKQEPKITIITPSYNQGQYIEKTIQSVLSQDYSNLEYIIIDGGSTDNTVEIIKKYEKHLKYWISEPDRGQSHAINKGLEHATGDIINWLNSDDYLEPLVLSKLANEFENNNIDVVCAYSNLLFDTKTIRKRTTQEDNIEKLVAIGQIMQPSTFFRKTIFDELTPLEESLHYMMDHYIWMQYILKYGLERIKYIDQTITNVLMHQDAKSVGSLSLFKHDKERILASIFRAKQQKNSIINTLEAPLHFNLNVEIDIKKTEFLYLRDNIFIYNYKGKRIGINVRIILKLILSFIKRGL